ncbi:MAG: hypothetical protein ACI9LT_001213 [Pseudoalteromonas distincta]|jgi:hypothetical protein
MTLKTTFFAAAASLALIGAPAALAQDMDGAMTPPPATGAEPQAGASTFTDVQVDRFAEAMTDIQTLNETYGPRVAGAADTTARTALQQQMTTEMTAAVTQTGLTAEEYNQIAAAAQGDAALRARIGQAMQADAGTSADASAQAETPQVDAPEAEAGVEMDVEAEAETPPADM